MVRCLVLLLACVAAPTVVAKHQRTANERLAQIWGWETGSVKAQQRVLKEAAQHRVEVVQLIQLLVDPLQHRERAAAKPVDEGLGDVPELLQLQPSLDRSQESFETWRLQAGQVYEPKVPPTPIALPLKPRGQPQEMPKSSCCTPLQTSCPLGLHTGA